MATPADPPTSPPSGALSRRSFGILFAVMMSVAAGNTALQSVLPAIGRQIGIPDTLTAMVFSFSAVLWVFSAPAWAAASDRRGRKPMVLIGLAGFAASTLGFALMVLAGVYQLAAPLVIFGGLALTRSIFGLIGSASNPAAQAYIADRTSPGERTGAMATLASAFGLGTIVGPAIAPLFVLPFVGLSGPMFAFAVIAAVMFYVVRRYLPADEAVLPDVEAGAEPRPRPQIMKLWRDERLAPFIIYGFLIGSAQAVNGQTLGFLIIDKLALPPIQAQGFTAVAMMGGAVAGLLAQWGLIRMLNLGPRLLLWMGAALAAGGNVIIAFAPSYWAVVIGFFIVSLGYGFARPGFTAGSSLAVTREEQGTVAGAITAINGACFIVAPVLGVALYEWAPASPYLLNLVILLGLVVYALRNPTMRRVGEFTPEPEKSTVLEQT